ncbi:MAG TPA: class I SAM-dependent methyltransferase [Polyangiaceae bacterium]|nr:class I SAM-dependent methyltransferase [Polyangiaceae bacterium]
MATDYEALHVASLRAVGSGESTAYFAEYKLRCLERIAKADRPILDFGCGIGNLTEQLVKKFGQVSAYDPSLESLERARSRGAGASFYERIEAIPAGAFGTVVLAGVLHHVPPSQRNALLVKVRKLLQPDGKIVVFEHNPINPLTRRVVAACAFDDDAILLWPRELKKTLADAGFADVDLRYIVFFPKLLAFLRPLEPKLSRFLLGAQTMCVGANPH